jgi:hypothetical protein
MPHAHGCQVAEKMELVELGLWLWVGFGVDQANILISKDLLYIEECNNGLKSGILESKYAV